MYTTHYYNTNVNTTKDSNTLQKDGDVVKIYLKLPNSEQEEEQRQQNQKNDTVNEDWKSCGMQCFIVINRLHIESLELLF